MYTEVKSYQYIISLLKEYGISKCVLSSGSRNVPFVHSVEKDSYFKCYSIVDERSAGYFALGLSQELNEPVVISCTSSTATCNYWPAVAEAYYQNVPLVILTSDRDQRMIGQWEDQLIDQVGMYDRHVRKSVNLPIINDKDDEIYCQRLINEALLELNHNGAKGPVQINIPTNTYNRSFLAKELPYTKKIDRLFLNSKENWNNSIKELNEYKKILVICGQKADVSIELKKELEKFFENYNCAIVGDYMSNVNLDCVINTTISTDSNVISGKMFNELMPDLVISFGGQIFSGIKGQLKSNHGKFKHWIIQEDGKFIDAFKSLNKIFECRPEEAFKYFNEKAANKNSMEYYNDFKKYNDEVSSKKYKFEYSNVYAIKNIVESIPDNSILHLSINDSIRLTNFFDIPKNTRVYANIGTHGIDGCMSSFFGQSVASNKPCFLIIGDLSFFYDMNSIRINAIKNNVHILLINNHGGAEFYYNKIQQNDDRHTTARHNNIAEGWVKDNNFIYLSAHNKKEFDDNIKKFMKENERPIIFEVFTEMKTDAEEIHKFYNSVKPKDLKTEVITKSKDFVKKNIGQEKAKKILNLFDK